MSIKELRKITGLTQKEFASKYRFSIKQVQSWEEGWRNTPKCILYLLKRAIQEDYANKL